MKKILLYLSLGSNIGDRKYNILRALECLDKAFKVPYSRLSSLIETDPWGFDCDEKFIMAVVVYDLDFPMVFDPEKAGESILDICKGIEADFGRISKVQYDGYGRRIYFSRIIDIDILFLGNERIDTEILTVPHRLMHLRDFVMIPLREVATGSVIDSFPEIFN